MRLRHPHGRGLLLDDAEANRGTFIDKTSSASGHSKLRDCRLLEGSRAEGSCQIYGGEFYSTSIGGETVIAGSPRILDSTIVCSEVSGTPWISHASLSGNTEVCGSPHIIGAYNSRIVLRDAIVYGHPQICGTFIVTGRVHEGTWTRPPKHIKLPWVDLSECVVRDGEQRVLLDCRCRSVSYWMNHGAKLARRWGWSEDMIAVTINTIGREFSDGVVGNSGSGIQGASGQDAGDVRAGVGGL